LSAVASLKPVGGKLVKEQLYGSAAISGMTNANNRKLMPITVELHVSAADRRVARYAAAAIALTVAEAAIPTPLPGIKPGLANIIVLVVLARHGWLEATWVSLLRVVAGSLLVGQFLAPGFFLSLTGAALSLGVLALAHRFPARWFGPVSQSILAAFAHIGGQVLLARAWLVPHDGVFYLVPVFALFALIFGIINGLIAARLLQED
jgi:heptaprenyl diphosphate synthase